MLKNIEKTHKSAFFYENIWSYQKKAVPLHSLSKRKCGILKNGAVVQLVRIHACHAWGRGFESRPHRKKQSERVASFFVFLVELAKLAGLAKLVYLVFKKAAIDLQPFWVSMR